MPAVMPQRETQAPPAKRVLSRREKVFIAVLGSILLHLAILLLLGLFAQNRPAPPAAASQDPIRVEIQEEAPTPTPAPGEELVPAGTPTPPPYIATNDNQASATPPPDPAFQSDKDTLAASELPAAGKGLLPAQEGKNRPSFAFATRPYTPGEKAAQTSQPADADDTKPDPAAPAVSPPPETTPPRPQADRSAPRATPKPAAASTPAPTPAPDEIAMLAPTPTPAPEPSADPSGEPAPAPQPTPFDFSVRQPNPPTKEQPSPLRRGAKRPPSAGYQPQTARNLVSSSSISNHGASSVAALGTPLGRYTKAMNDAIGSRWYMYVNNRADLANIGMVKVKFTVDRNGKVRAPKIVQSSANESLGTICLAAIMEADLPPIPPEVIAVISGGQLEEELSFYVE